MILVVMVLGIPAMIVASKKGFADGRWLLTFGLIGLIVVSCLPSARKRGISHNEARRRRNNADETGKIICIINAIVIVIYGLVHVFSQSAAQYYPGH